MTQSDFPFGPAAEDEFSEQPPVERSDETRTNILIGAGGALAAIAMAAGFLVFAGGGDDADDVLAAAPAGPRTPVIAKPTPTKPPANTPRIEPEPVAEPVGRDPFAPLYRPPVPVVAPVAPVGAVPGAPVGGVVVPGGTTTDGTSTGGMPVAPVSQPAPSDPQPTSHQLRMVRVYQSGGIWHTELTLDGRVYRPKVGETFAESFQLVSTQESCGSFLFGDERFDLCVGEITVRQK